jgi:hypothetical protein
MGTIISLKVQRLISRNTIGKKTMIFDDTCLHRFNITQKEEDSFLPAFHIITLIFSSDLAFNAISF